MATSAQQPSELVLVGRIGAPWGVKGHTRVQSYTTPPSKIFEYHQWTLEHSGEKRQVVVEAKDSKPSHMVVKLDGVADRDIAQTYVHSDIYVERSSFDDCDEDEYYWVDLQGLRVCNQDGTELGVVEHLYETGAHDNMMVRGQADHHIPFVLGRTVVDVNLAEKKITVDWVVDV